MRSPLLRIERARPLLGTTVAIRVQGLGEADGHRAVDEAFAEIALIHRLMSFQEWDSDVSRLNREAYTRTQDVHPATFEVLYWAREIAEASEGCFDITVAGKLVDWGILPAPASRHPPDAQAYWRDVELGEDYSVRFRRPLFIDVSGIAKGYAVDRAIERLESRGVTQACVNAGGDLRVYGPEMERVMLQPEHTPPDGIPVLEIANAAVASSGGHLERRRRGGQICGPHVDGRKGEPVATDCFVSVVAESCMMADALTKPVLVLQEESTALLRRYGASAHIHDPERGWRHSGRRDK
jgi:thiamine biosynthesis lipoprotein